MTFDQRKLQAFLAVARTGSLGRATHEVALSQPALSRLIQELENRLGDRLFDRVSRGMILTDAGRTLVPHASRLLFEMEQAADALHAVRGVTRGSVRIGAVATIARGLLPEAVDRLLASAPELRVSLLEESAERLFQALANYEIDLVIAGAGHFGELFEPVGECVLDSAFRVFCSAEHRLTRRGHVDLEELLTHSWVMAPRGSVDRDFFDTVIGEQGLPPARVAVETASASSAISFVDRTSLLGWLPRPLFAGAERAGRFRVLDIPQLVRHERFFAYRRAQGQLPHAARQLVTHLPLTGLQQASPTRSDPA